MHTLKPYIDIHYRTLPGRNHTYMAGSSMGSLISFFGALHYPDIFGKAGIFSPSLWLVPNILEEMQTLIERNTSLPKKLFFYGGENEGANMVQHIMDVIALLKRYPRYAIQVNVDAEGEHCEICWRDKFSAFLSMAHVFNLIIAGFCFRAMG